MDRFLDKIKITFNEDTENYFQDVLIENVKKDVDKNEIGFYLLAFDLIPYKYICDVKESIETAFCELMKKKVDDENIIAVNIYMHYKLSELYTTKLIFENVKDEISKELKDSDRIIATLFDKLNYEFIDDSNIKIIFEDIKYLREEQEKLIDIIKDIFKYRYDIDLNVEVVYVDKSVGARDDRPQSEGESYDRPQIDLIQSSTSSPDTGSGSLQPPEISQDNRKGSLQPPETKKTNKFKKFHEDSEILYGNKPKGKYRFYELRNIIPDMRSIMVNGIIYKYSHIETKTGGVMFYIYITDIKDVIPILIFGNKSDIPIFDNIFKMGDTIEVYGNTIEDQNKKMPIIKSPVAIKKVGHRDIIDFGTKGSDDYYNIILTDREDNESEKRVELHLHTKSSVQDGIGEVKAYIATARKFGMHAMAITDHGAVNALADANSYLNELFKNKTPDIKIINGVEGYLVEGDEIYYFDKDDKTSIRNHSLDDDFVVFTFITTGQNLKNDNLVWILAEKVSRGVIVSSFNQKIHIDKPMSHEAKERTGLMDSDLKNAKDIKEVLTDFMEFSKGAVFVTLNKKQPFKLHDLLDKYDVPYDNKAFNDSKIDMLDMTILSRLAISDIKKYDLSSIARHLKVKVIGITDRKKDAKKERLSHNDYLKLFTCTFIELIKHLKNEYNISNLNELTNKFVIDENFIKRQKYYHIILLAKNDVGRVNLYKIVSDSHINYMYNRKPRIPRSLLVKYREGLIIGSACIAGELMDAIRYGSPDEELKNIAQFYDYLEVQPTMNNSFLLSAASEQFKTKKDLENLNKKVIEIGEAIGKPVVATCDCHYVEKEDKIYRQMLQIGFKSRKTAASTSDSIEDTRDEELYFRTTREMLDEFSYLGVDKSYEIVVKNTNLINDMIEDIKPVRLDKCPPKIEGSDDLLRNTCYENLKKMYGENPDSRIKERLDKELDYIISNGYSVMYISAKKVIDYSKDNGYPVGSRGSVGSSLAATLSGVSEINPLPPHYICPKCHHLIYETEETKKYYDATGFDMPDKICEKCGTPMEKDGINIPFETFLGVPGSIKEPDIDLNFCSTFQRQVHKFTKDLFGEENTFKAGTVGTVATKTAKGYVRKFADTMSDDRQVSNVEVEYFANRIVGCKNTTGQHPGGMIVVPEGEYIYTFTPIQVAADKVEEDDDDKNITTHYDYHKIDENLLKLDLLGHESPTTLKKLKEYTKVDFYKVPFYDEKVMKLFSTTESLGITKSDISGENYKTSLGCLTIPEFGTDFAMGMCEEAKPKTIADLIRLSGLAHGTDVWQNNVQDLIKNEICDLTHAICCRDDIMLYLIEKGLDDVLSFNIMEKVRKGKHLTTTWEQEMRTHDIPEWYIGCCNKIQYMFPKAHAAAYVIASLRIAYYKVYYPLEYYAVYFSIRKEGFDYKLMMMDREHIHFQIEEIAKIIEKRKNDRSFRDEYNRVNRMATLDVIEKAIMKYSGINDDRLEKTDEELLNEKYESMSVKNLRDLFMCYRIVEEMKARNIDFCPIDIYKAKASDFIVVDGKIMPSFDSIQGVGYSVAAKCESEGIKGNYNSIEDFKSRTGVNATKIEEMKKMGIFGDLKDGEDTIFDFLSNN